MTRDDDDVPYNIFITDYIILPCKDTLLRVQVYFPAQLNVAPMTLTPSATPSFRKHPPAVCHSGRPSHLSIPKTKQALNDKHRHHTLTPVLIKKYPLYLHAGWHAIALSRDTYRADGCSAYHFTSSVDMTPSAASSAVNVAPLYCTQSITSGSFPLLRTDRSPAGATLTTLPSATGKICPST